MASYTSKYVGVLEGDLGVLSVKLPLRSLVELRTAGNGSVARRPSSAPMGTIGAPTVALTAAATSGAVASGAGPGQSVAAIVHGGFAPRALRACPKPQASASRHDVGAARLRQAQTSKGSGYMVHSAVSGSRLTQPNVAHRPVQKNRLDDDDRPRTTASHQRVQRFVDSPEGLDATVATLAEPSADRAAVDMPELSNGGAAELHAAEPEAAAHELYLRYVRVKKALAAQQASRYAQTPQQLWGHVPYRTQRHKHL